MSIVGRYYWERGVLVEVLIQWGLKSRGESYGGPRNVLVERLDGSGVVVVRPFRGLRVAYTYVRGNRVPRRRLPEPDDPALAAWDAERMLPCGTCGRDLWVPPGAEPAAWNAHDPCIADLPGVRFACCGHGVGERYDGDPPRAVEAGGRIHDDCYVVFDDGLTLYGNAARAAMRVLGGDPPDAPAGAVPLGRRFVVPPR